MKYLFFSILVLLLVAGCGVEPGENLDRSNAIELRSIDISADADRAYLDRTITITTKCKPLLKGKGRIALIGAGDFRDSSMWTIESPVQDTILDRERKLFPVMIAASFDPDNELVQQWRIQLYSQGDFGSLPYYFQAWATMDSTFIADSNRYFPTESPEVRRYSRDGRGFEPGATSTVLRLEES